jgi:hypothetical protein
MALSNALVLYQSRVLLEGLYCRFCLELTSCHIFVQSKRRSFGHQLAFLLHNRSIFLLNYTFEDCLFDVQSVHYDFEHFCKLVLAHEIVIEAEFFNGS